MQRVPSFFTYAAGGSLSALLIVSGCSMPAPGAGGASIHDPHEQTNRAVHEFNKGLDSAFLRPAGQVAAQLPAGLRDPVRNFAANTELPGMVVNNVLQADLDGVITNTFRFLLNSTVGVLGLYDPATAIGIHAVEADFGQTLAVWGVPEGAYVELPLLGPSTERDAFGEVVDILLNPLDSLGNDAMTRWDRPAWIGEQVIDRGVFGNTVDSVLYDSADSYAQLRLMYLQNRRYELGQPAAAAADTCDADFIDPYAEAGCSASASVMSDPGFIDPYEALQ